MDFATRVIVAVSASESASLHGHKAKTPVISGAVTGGCIGLAWLIGFIIYFYKRYRRERRARRLGFRSHREMLDPPKKAEAFIIPPDPAIIEAGHKPGENIYDDPRLQESDFLKHARTLPLAQSEHAHDLGEQSPVPHIPHASSAPSRVPRAFDPPPSLPLHTMNR